MSKFRFKIDEKSLFYGIKNDFKRGQSATVHTPINQSKDPAKWHNDILELTKHNIESKYIPEMLERQCLPNTTSQAKSKLNQFFEFRNILLDGSRLECKSSFGMYIKEETDQYIIDRNGHRTLNTHLGRLKLHYPTTLLYKRDGFNVDNKDVLDSIIKQNGGFAFVVRAFEYDTDEQTINFITSLIGPKDIPLSNVFLRQKGTGQKLLLNDVVMEDTYTFLINNVTDFDEQLSYMDQIRRNNGAMGEQIIMQLLSKRSGITDVYHTSDEYPYSPYDIEYIEDGVKKYVEVKATSTNEKKFNMSNGEIQFMESHTENYKLYLVTNVTSKDYKINEYTSSDIAKFQREYPRVRFTAR